MLDQSIHTKYKVFLCSRYLYHEHLPCIGNSLKIHKVFQCGTSNFDCNRTLIKEPSIWNVSQGTKFYKLTICQGFLLWRTSSLHEELRNGGRKELNGNAKLGEGANVANFSLLSRQRTRGEESPILKIGLFRVRSRDVANSVNANVVGLLQQFKVLKRICGSVRIWSEVRKGSLQVAIWNHRL